MGDDWYGHRDLHTGEPEGDREEWIEWDYLLMRTLQLIEDYTNEHGLLRWEIDDPEGRVNVDAIKKIDKFREAQELKTGGKNYKPSPGEYFIPRLSKLTDEWPTLAEYIKAQVEEKTE